MQKAMSKIGALLLSLFLVLGVTAAMVPAFATEPEDLTSVTVYDRDGRVITVGKEPGTDTWSALANGQSFTIYTGLAPNQYGMWYCAAGRVKFDYTGLVQFQDEIWYVENGKVNIDYYGEKEVGDQVYTIERGKVVNQDYTDATKKKMAKTVAGFIAIVALFVFLLVRNKRKDKEEKERIAKIKEEEREAERERKQQIARETYKDQVENSGLTYKKNKYLTNREKAFYPYLKEVADELGYTVSIKPRLGDLVTGADNQYTSQGMKERSKVQQKHVDFALFDPETLEVQLIVELDDTTHEQQSRVNRDLFVDNVLKGTGYKILHVYDETDLENKIRDELNSVASEEDKQ